MGVLGLIVFVAACYLLSSNRRAISWRIVGWGLSLQGIIAVLVLGVPGLGFSGPLRPLFVLANDLVVALLHFTNEGSRFIFGDLVETQKYGHIFAFQILPTILFVSSLTAILYHLRILPRVVAMIARFMQFTLKTSGAESLAMAANIFVGQTEAPLLVKPYLIRMTKSELFSLMVGGMATVAGGVLASYVGMLKDQIHDIAGHLLTASLMSAPAAFVAAKMMIPETEEAETSGRNPQDTSGVQDANVLEAATRGASEGLHLALNVGAMLLAFIALVALFDGLLGWLGGHVLTEQKLSLSLILGWLFAPVAWLIGIPWHEATFAGALLGEKVALNEFVAYIHLSQEGVHLSEKTKIILSYALCGFANFSSIAIQVGGIGALAPERRADLARLGVRSLIAGTLACLMTAAWASLLV